MTDREILGRMTVDELRVMIGTKMPANDLAPFTGESLAKVFVLDGPVQGKLVEQILEQEGIPFLLQSHRDTAYDGLFIPTRGWGMVITREQDAAQARETIEAVLAAEHEGQEPKGQEDDE